MSPSSTIPFLDMGAMHAEVREDLDERWRSTIDSSGFVGGAAVAEFEAEFAHFCDCRSAVGVANGTDALELILRGLGVGPGDEVIMPTNTFFATAEAVCNVGASPVFIDVDPTTLLMTSTLVDTAITSRTAAVIAVHLFGQMPDMDAIAASCRTRGIHLLEDAAQAHGATWAGARAGSFGVAAAFSFYPGKNLGALGDGGAVVTNDAALADRIRSLANHGRSVDGGQDHAVIGVNSRLDALQASALSVKLARLSDWNQRRRQVHDWYRDALPDGAVPLRVASEAGAVHHLEVVQVDGRDEVRERLANAGVATGVHYAVPCHRLPVFRDRVPQQSLPVAEAAAGRILSLPMFPHLDRPTVEAICSRLGEALGKVAA
ncbi:MAG TPA: DegT/DnrJ/EryC1/StrS family aminotransferase [Ilumatobacteraceae bacterium]|nr:DegT/DnrJ/EryC1/StrS family aminotransferase [Ilumatobacteraceae bacterium]